ncbi:MAG: hypothetical protein ABIO44_10850, partial [Saprospiraceae bacterium]
MKLFPIILILFITLMSSSQKKSDMEKLEWILDNWVTSGDEVVSYEKWAKINDTLFTGESKTIRNGKEISS